MSDQTPPESRISLQLQYLGTMITAAPFAIAIIRIAAVSELNPTVLAILLQTVDVVTLFIRSLIDLIPLATVVIVSTYVATRPTLLPMQKWKVDRLFLRFITFGWLGALFITPLYVALLIALTGIWALLNRFIRKDLAGLSWAQRREAEKRDLREQTLLATGMLVSSLIILSHQMWLPPQILEYDTERRVAYILEETDRTTTLLTESDRTILVVNTDTIRTRQPCTKGHSWTSEPIIGLISSQSPRLPKCPKK